jgi:hypothetical protein
MKIKIPTILLNPQNYTNEISGIQLRLGFAQGQNRWIGIFTPPNCPQDFFLFKKRKKYAFLPLSILNKRSSLTYNIDL